MKTVKNEAQHIERLKWAISLSQTKFGALRDGDWLNLRTELSRFTYESRRMLQNSSQVQGASWGRVTPESFTCELLGEIANDFHAWFLELANKKEQYKNAVFNVPLRYAAYNDTACFFVEETPDGHFAPRFALDDVRLAAKIALGLHFVESRITRDQIRACDSCETLFLMQRKPQIGKAAHCNARCARNAANRAYRHREAEKLKVQEKLRNKKRYAKKVRAKYKNARIKSRS